MPIEELLAGLRARRAQVALVALLLLGLGATAILAWPRSYVAEAVVAPAETTGIATSSLLSASPTIGGLLDPRPTGNFAIYLAALRSTEAAAMLVAETGMLRDLTARRATWPGGALRELLGLRTEADLDDIRVWLARHLSVTQQLGSVTWTLALAHPDRGAALEALRESSENQLRDARARSDAALMHLRHDLEQLRGRLVRRLDDGVGMLEVGLTALRNKTPRVDVMIERAEMVSDALRAEVKNLREE